MIALATERPQWTWTYLRGPVQVITLLTDLGPPIKGGCAKTAGNIARCKKPGPALVCRGKWYDPATRRCSRTLGEIPDGVGWKAHEGQRICEHCTPDAMREPGIQTSHDPKFADGPSVPLGKAGEIRAFLEARLVDAIKHPDFAISRAAKAYRHDADCTVEESLALGYYILGQLEERKPWKK